MAIPAVPQRQRLLSNDSSHSITSTGSNGSGGSDSSDLSAGTRRRLARVRRLSGRIQAVATKSSSSGRGVEAGNGHTRRSSAPPASLSQLRVRVLKRVGSSDAHVPYVRQLPATGARVWWRADQVALCVPLCVCLAFRSACRGAGTHPSRARAKPAHSGTRTPCLQASCGPPPTPPGASRRPPSEAPAPAPAPPQALGQAPALAVAGPPPPRQWPPRPPRCLWPLHSRVTVQPPPQPLLAPAQPHHHPPPIALPTLPPPRWWCRRCSRRPSATRCRRPTTRCSWSGGSCGCS